MKNNDVIIKEVTIARKEAATEDFCIFNDESVSQKRSIVFEQIKTITCVIDEVNNKAIDIETKEVWDIIRRNDKGHIIPEDYEKAFSGEPCALRIKEKDWEKMSMLYQLSLKDRGRKVLQNYFSSLEQSGPIKTLKNKKRN